MNTQNMIFPKGSSNPKDFSEGVLGTFPTLKGSSNAKGIPLGRSPLDLWHGAGRLNMASGKLNMASGKLNMASGKLNMDSGKLNMASGKLNMASGRLNMASGGLNMA